MTTTYSLVLFSIFCHFLVLTNGSLVSVSEKLSKLKIATSSSSLKSESSMRDNHHQQQRIPRPLTPPPPFTTDPSSPKFKTNTKTFLDLRPEAYINRFGSSTPDFDSINSLVTSKTLQTEYELKKKIK